MVIDNGNLQRRYLRWRISQSRRNGVAAPPRQTACCCWTNAGYCCWRCSRAWSKSRLSWRCSPVLRMAPYILNRAPDRAAPMPESMSKWIIQYLSSCRYYNSRSEKKTRRTVVTWKIGLVFVTFERTMSLFFIFSRASEVFNLLRLYR